MSDTSKPSSPLLRLPEADAINEEPSRPYRAGSIGPLAVTALGGAKMLLGVGAIAAPRLLGKVFLLHVPAESYIIMRLFGSSCAALGGSLVVTHRKASTHHNPASSEVLRAAVIANLVADTVDSVTCCAALATGALGTGTFGMLGGGCAALAVLGAVGYQGLQ